MRKSLIILPAIAGLLVVGVAGPASAEDTTVTVEVTGGALTITVPATLALAAVPASTTAQLVNAPLGTVEVSDLRGTAAGWSVTAASADVVGSELGGAISYATDDATFTGAVAIVATDVPVLSTTAAAVQTATATGANTGTWTPTIELTVPAGALAGAYSATITHSVA